MWWKFAVFLLFFIATGINSQEISCNYINRGGNYPYTCQLTINNPQGSDNFTSIPGQHVEGFTDADVLLVDSFGQNSLNVPSIICRQFPNLRDFYFAVNNVELIGENSFADCRNMMSVILLFNSIRNVPANTFRNNPNLQFIYLNWNGLTELNQDSFTGSAALFIDLEFNNLGAGSPNGLFRGSWFNSVNSTLQSLNIMGNNLNGLEVNAFTNLGNLAWLDLTGNILTTISESSFNGLSGMRDLYLIECGLSSLNPTWFRDMPILEDLHIEFNGIRELPVGIFSTLESLTNLYLGYNNLTEFSIAPLGETAFNLEVLSLTQNQIFAIEPALFDKLENINSIEMTGNVCNQDNIVNIQNNRDQARIRLRRCFDNFGPRFIRCAFSSMAGNYGCTLTVRNAEGTDFPTIEGNHLSERFDEDVVLVYGSYQNTRIFPQVICRQFRGVQDILLFSSYIEVINEESFQHCILLENLHLDFNAITSVPDNTFRNSPSLQGLFLNGNNVAQISANSFAGTRINFLDLGNNLMTSINSDALLPINSTLSTLELFNNRLTTVESNTFANARNIRNLIISGNVFFTVAGDAFQPLSNLEFLGMSNCGLTTINPDWLVGLSNLHTLYLGTNNIRDLQPNVFNPLTSLHELHIYNNELIELRRDSFGASLSSLNLIYAIGNSINIVDPEIVRAASNLEYLFLVNNFCTDLNFYGVNDNQDFVLERIERCTDNFAVTPSATCTYTGNIGPGSLYWCTLEIQNPLGVEFERIAGEHIGTATDDNVVFLTIEGQNTRVIPSVICRQFGALRQLNVYTSFLNVIERDAFTHCQGLTSLYLMQNNFTTIPSGSLSHLTNLRVLLAPMNRIQELSQGSFQGTAIEELDLSWNQFVTWNEFWVYPLSTTLRILNLSHNRISTLRPTSFNSAWNLEELRLTDNPLRTFEPDTLRPLVNLRVLHLAGCEITEIEPVWFTEKPNLRVIELDSNRIRDLPVGVFDIASLQHVGLVDNSLKAVDVLSFGASLRSLINIDFRQNFIEIMDAQFFDNATALFSMELADNVCANFDVIDIPENRQIIRDALSPCFQAFDAVGASCEFEEFEALYRCQLTINNQPGKHRFDRIEGTHLGNANDNYVTYIVAEDQYTRSIPLVLCQQYRFVEGIAFIGSKVEAIVPETFANCEFLYSLTLMMNSIRVIPSGAFRNNQYLASVRLDGNQISIIAPDVFVGTQVYNLNLEHNLLPSISRAVLEPIAGSLMFLDLRSNRLTSIPRGLFAGMNRMFYLDLTANDIGVIPSDSFHSMQFLGRLFLANCKLRTLTPRHFQEKPFLFQLEIDGNFLTYLAPNVLNIPGLQTLGISANQIEMLDSASFGASLQSLTFISAVNNRISGIDSFMLSSRTLNAIELQGNLCTDINFIDIQDNLEVVRMYLNSCFINFRRRNDLLRCEYENQNQDYICMLEVNNEEGHNDFGSVEGTHLTGRLDMDVTRVQARNQFTRRIPGRICQQFNNLRDLIIIDSQVLEVTYQAFQHCRNLQYLNINHNQITVLPPQFLINSPNLRTFSSYNNRISEIWDEAFLGTQIRYLDVNINRLTTFPQRAFEAVNETLTELFVDYNQFVTLPNQAFANMRNIQTLDLTGNVFDLIPSNAFVGLENLLHLSLTYCGITRLNPAWFTPLTNLTVLYLSNNEITWLPFGVFAPLRSLFNLMLSSNHLTELRVGSFGATLNNLWYLYADYNQINGIEDALLDELSVINWLMLGGNICTQGFFMDVPNNLPQVRNELSQCISNFRQDSIRCEYYGGGDEGEYFCILEVHNPDGVEFETIGGDHSSGLGNNDVVFANAFYQNTRTIPSVICRQFPNLATLTISSSQLEVILTEAFSFCFNIEQIFINQNRIQTVWPFAFGSSPRLRVLDLGYNEISFIHQSAFRNTSIELLSLSFNRLPTYNQVWCDDIAETLVYLDLSFNQIVNLPNGTFTNLVRLEDLEMVSNPVSVIPGDAFIGLTQLHTLGLSRTNIREVNPSWFTSLSSLRLLYLQNNQIQLLQPTVFAPLTSLTDLYLYGNRIREVNRNSFGTGLAVLERFYLGDNLINFFDQQFLIDATSLDYLLLSGNLCIDQDFLNVRESYWRVFEELRQCTDNFYSEPWLSCNYINAANSYTCEISIQNPRGLSFDAIEGEHVADRNSNDVTDIWGLYQNTMTIPTIVCESFSNLRAIFLWYSNLEVIDEETFAGCANLVEINLQFNWIHDVPDFTFRNTPNLRTLDLNFNRIATLSDNSFAGTSIDYLDVALNQLSQFNPAWFVPINETLRLLDLLGNNIVSLPSDGFANLRNVQRLILNNNPLWNIPGDAFRFADNLFDLYIGGIGISELNPLWFDSLPSLEDLHIQNNNIGSFPDGVFRSLLRLRRLEFYNNNVRSLNANAFGQLQSLTSILAQNNRIRAFDPAIIDRASNLQWLMLSGNICNRDDFSDVANNRDFVRQRLSFCFANSAPEVLQCRFSMYDTDYTCSLTIFNPLGREEFNSVEGEHLEGRGNNDVTYLYSAYGNTLNVPGVICNQFPNLIEISLLADQIEYIDSASFEGCTEIRNIWLYANLIEVIPSFVFINNPHLDTLIIENNRISEIGDMAFLGTAIRYLDLAGNPLGEFNPRIVSGNGETLRVLNLGNTGLTSLQAGSFNQIPNLVELTLSNNRFENLRGDIFGPLTQLQDLVMNSANLRNLNPEWFAPLRSLVHLYIPGNSIFEIPHGMFDSLVNLTSLYMYNNNLRVIDTESFGASIRSLQTLYTSVNEISGIDPTFLGAAENLNILMLAANNCSQSNFFDIPTNRESVERELQQCFDNYIGEIISCEYFQSRGDYGCRLSINNPIGRDTFTIIPGPHIPGFSNDDVTLIELVNQNTRNIPAIVCQQFPNVEYFVAMSNNIDVITSRSFAACPELEYVNLFSNNIVHIPANAFVNNPELEHIELGLNRIETLHPLAFAGTDLGYIDLAINSISVFDPTWFEVVNGSLKSLDLLNNQITTLQPDAFRTLRELEILVLNGNPLRNVPGNAFIALDDLRVLLLSNTQLNTVNPDWFRALRSLEILGLNNNGIEQLPPNTFNSLTNIHTININNNFLWELTTQQFGSGPLQTIRVIDVQNNVINVVDSSLVTAATNLNYLLLAGNICIDQNFDSVADYLWTVLEYLMECTDNFVVPAEILCTYGDLTAGTYMCTLTSFNPRGLEFAEIPGEHRAGMNDSNVAVVYSRGQNMRIIPAAICRQFPNMQQLMIFESHIERLTPTSFQNCRNIESIFINDGLLRTVPDNTFFNNPRLTYLSLGGNRLTRLAPNSLRGSSIDFLDLSNNLIAEFTPEAYEPINATLTVLDLLNNRITGFPYSAFENIAGITQLVLNFNPLRNIPFEFIYPLFDLELLSMANCGLTELHHTWFFTNVNLRQLYVQNNNLPNFQSGVFHNLTSLELIYFYGNQITLLEPISFGNALASLRVVNGPSNLINAIDPEFIDGAESLEYLLLNSNICVDASFGDVSNNLDEVRAGLSACFDNFANQNEDEMESIEN